MVRSRIRGALGIGLALAWTCWPSEGPSLPPLTAELRAGAAAEPSSGEVAVPPGGVGNQPQGEAAGLKRAAVEMARQVAEAYPEDALSYALLGSAYYNTGRSEEAVKQLRKCLELSPNQADAYEILARVAYEKGQLDEAVRLSQEALKRGPANPAVLNQLGRAFMDLGRMEEAVRTLEQAVGLPQTISESSYLLGQALL